MTSPLRASAVDYEHPVRPVGGVQAPHLCPINHSRTAISKHGCDEKQKDVRRTIAQHAEQSVLYTYSSNMINPEERNFCLTPSSSSLIV